MDTKPDSDRGPNESAWQALIAEHGEDDPWLNLALTGALASIQRHHDPKTWVKMDAADWEKLYSYALDNYRELVTL